VFNKKAGIGLPIVALVAIFLIALTLIAYSIYFFVFGFGNSKDITIDSSQFHSDMTLINILKTKTESGDNIIADLITEPNANREEILKALGKLPGEQTLEIGKVIISETNEYDADKQIQTAVLPSNSGVIEVKLYV